MRHHHLLCATMFTGHGYDGPFVTNMSSLVDTLRDPSGLEVRLSMSADDICSLCPRLVEGRCKDHELVLIKDRSASGFLGLPEECTIPAWELMELVRRKVSGLDRLGRVCGRCEWSELCDRRLREMARERHGREPGK